MDEAKTAGLRFSQQARRRISGHSHACERAGFALASTWLIGDCGLVLSAVLHPLRRGLGGTLASFPSWAAVRLWLATLCSFAPVLLVAVSPMSFSHSSLASATTANKKTEQQLSPVPGDTLLWARATIAESLSRFLSRPLCPGPVRATVTRDTRHLS
jgi:hypothetical protein